MTKEYSNNNVYVYNHSVEEVKLEPKKVGLKLWITLTIIISILSYIGFLTYNDIKREKGSEEFIRTMFTLETLEQFSKYAKVNHELLVGMNNNTFNTIVGESKKIEYIEALNSEIWENKKEYKVKVSYSDRSTATYGFEIHYKPHTYDIVVLGIKKYKHTEKVL